LYFQAEIVQNVCHLFKEVATPTPLGEPQQVQLVSPELLSSQRLPVVISSQVLRVGEMKKTKVILFPSWSGH